MKYTPRNFRKTARQEVANKEQSDFLIAASGVFNNLCDNAMTYYGEMDGQITARALGQEIRDNALDNLHELLERFEANAVLNGAKVLWAKDGNEACEFIGKIIEHHEVKTITKGKSTITEEIKLNDYITNKTNANVYEGDLGKFIIHLNESPEFHMVEPTINLKLEEIVDILHNHIDMPVTEDTNKIAQYVREFLREKFEKVDMGITGVNQAIASTGSLLLVENEGNIRWSTSAPRVHVALMCIEKVCDNISDAFYLTDLLTRNSTGQAITSYVSFINGPKVAQEKDAPEETYIIILDNGRTEAYADEELRSVLRCIRCGRCSIKCPVYLRIGAYPYGNPYPGPLGAILMPLIVGLDETKHLYQACTFCGACEETCPVGVPHTQLIKKYREIKATGDRKMDATTNVWNKMFAQSFARIMSNRTYYDRSLIGLRAYFNSNAADGNIKNVPGPMQSWFIYRDFPELPENTFRDYWDKEGHLVAREGEKDG